MVDYIQSATLLILGIATILNSLAIIKRMKGPKP